MQCCPKSIKTTLNRICLVHCCPEPHRQHFIEFLPVFRCFPVFYGIFKNQIVNIHGVGYKIAEASRVEHLVIIVEGFQPFIIIITSSI